jgi:phosphoheptose isomerase
MAKMLDTSPNWTQTKPTTRVSTRQLGFFNVAIASVEVNAYAADSVFSKAVRGAMTQTEMFAIGRPASGNFIIVVAHDTAGDRDITEERELGGNNYNTMAQRLEVAIEASTGGSATVTRKHLEGSGLATMFTTYSDESVNEDC